MSQPPGTPTNGSADESDEPRPRPSYGHPGPAETPSETQPEQPSYGRSQPSYGQPSYGQPSYGQPGQPSYGQPSYGQTPYGQPGQAAWPPQQEYGSQPSASQYGQDLGRHEQAYAQMYGEKPRTGMAIASLVLGILALLTCWFPIVSYAAVVMALLAVIFGVVGVRRTSGRGMAIAGLVLGGIALVAAVLFSIFYTGIFIDATRVAQDCADENPSLGSAYEQCVTDRTDEIIPFQEARPAELRRTYG